MPKRQEDCRIRAIFTGWITGKKTENVRKGYMLGRYGTMPYIREDDLEW